MTYRETLDWLFSRLPMYQRVGHSAFKADLKATEQLMRLLDHPEKKFKSVHVAGTNGKGSVSHMLAAVFQKAGYKTGLYTSPHLKDFRERIRLNGRMIPEEEVVHFVEHHKAEFQELQLSFFEMTVGLAFDYFSRQQVDIAIIEVGMGGRLDSTNVITPELSIITNISLDHTRYLGSTLPAIAREKAGIIKAGIPVVVGEVNPQTRPVFKAVTKGLQAPLYLVDRPKGNELYSDLTGPYQRLNQATAHRSLEILEKQGFKLLAHEAQALREVKTLTGLRGRWDILQEHPKIIADTGHNEAGIKLLMNALAREDFHHLHIVWGMVDDKDSKAILQYLPRNAKYYFCTPAVPRGKEVSVLHHEARELGLNGSAFETVEAAYKAAQKNARKNDLIFVGGSTFVVAEVL